MAIIGKIGAHRRIGNGYKRFAKFESIENYRTMLRWREYYEKSSSGERMERDKYSIGDNDNGRDMQLDICNRDSIPGVTTQRSMHLS